MGSREEVRKERSLRSETEGVSRRFEDGAGLRDGGVLGQRWESHSSAEPQSSTSLRWVRHGGNGYVIAHVYCRKGSGWERPVIYMDGLLDTKEG